MDKGMKIYLAGPMSGVKDFNFPLFFDMAHALRAKGFEVVNPAENDGHNLAEAVYNATHNSLGDWSAYLRRDLRMLLGCDGVVLLPGWSNSRGARLEQSVARRLQMQVIPIKMALAMSDERARE